MSLIALAVPVLLQGGAALKPREANHFFFDAKLRAPVVVTGQGGAEREGLWRHDGRSWSLIDVQNGPPSRELSGGSYDTRRQRFVLYGGVGAAADTWEWDGAAWHVIRDAAAGPRDHHSMAFDEHRGRTVLFGGADGRALVTTTWEWDGTQWKQVAADGPPVRAHFPMVYDPVRRHVLVYGGLSGGPVPRNDTWAWDGTAWRKLAEGGPPARTHHRGAFDAARGVFVVFGGLRSGNPRAALGDTWTWNGREWTEMPVAGPPPRSGHVMTWDPQRRVVLLYGGGSFDGKSSTRYEDLWQWDGTRWTQASER